MASNEYKKLFVAMVVVLGLFASGAKSHPTVNKFCRTSDNKDLCTTMVRGATTLHDATRNAVESALRIAKELQKMHQMLDPAVGHLPPKSKQSVLDTCRQNFDNDVDDLKSCLKFVDKNDMGGLNAHLSALTSSDCIDAFDEFGTAMPPQVAGKLNMLNQAADNCLAVSQQI